MIGLNFKAPQSRPTQPTPSSLEGLTLMDGTTPLRIMEDTQQIRPMGS